MNNFHKGSGDGRGGGRHSGGGTSHALGQREAAKPSADMALLLSKISLRTPDVTMFDQTAQGIADVLKAPIERNHNKSSQVRRFYDEVIRFSDRHRPNRTVEAAFARDLPFIRMISAHAAYAETRGLVDANFRAFIQGCVRQVDTAGDLDMFRTLFEAVVGFLPKKL